MHLLYRFCIESIEGIATQLLAHNMLGSSDVKSKDCKGSAQQNPLKEYQRNTKQCSSSNLLHCNALEVRCEHVLDVSGCSASDWTTEEQLPDWTVSWRQKGAGC